MSNARNLADLLGTSTKSNQVISTSGAITTTGAFTSVGIDDNADATTITIDSNEHVGIGTASPSAQLHIDEADSNTHATVRLEGNNRGGKIEMYQGSTIVSDIQGDQSGNIYFNTSGAYGNSSVSTKLILETAGDVDVESGDIYFSTAGKGIVLGATSNTDANTLDDYEEGTWDVAVACGTSGSITIRSDYNEGYYNKVGTLVHAQGYIVVSGVSSPSGYISIGLPFAAANTSSEGGDWSAASVTIQGSAKNVNEMNATLIPGGGQSIYVYASDATTVQADSANAIAADDSIYFSCTYRSA